MRNDLRRSKAIVERLAAALRLVYRSVHERLKGALVREKAVRMKVFRDPLRVTQAVTNDRPETELHSLCDAQTKMLLRRIGDDDVTAAEELKIRSPLGELMIDHALFERGEHLRRRLMARPKEVEFEVQALLSEPVKPSEQPVWVFVVLHPVVPGDPESPRWSWRACRTTQRAQLVEVKRQAEHDATFTNAFQEVDRDAFGEEPDERLRVLHEQVIVMLRVPPDEIGDPTREEVGESKVEVLSFARSSGVAELVFVHDQHRLCTV